MKTINNIDKSFSNCDVCKELIGGSSPVIEISYGFIDEDGSMWVEESITIHNDCKRDDLLYMLSAKIEKN